MRHLIMFSLLILLLVAVQFSKAQSVDEIINKHLDAIGGKSRLLAFQSIIMKGILNSPTGIEVAMTTTLVHGVGYRVDIAVAGSEGYRIMNTKKGWSYLPLQGQTYPQELPEEEVKFSQGSLDLQSSLLNYKEKGSTVELIGKEKVDNVEAYKLKLTASTGKVTTIYIDTNTYYRIKISSKLNPSDNIETEVTYSDFKKQEDGYVFPYAQTNLSGTIHYTSIEVNKPVDEKIFSID